MLGRSIDTVDVPLEAAREQMIAVGRDPDFADGAMRGRRFIAEGANARLTNDGASVIGRTARTYETWADDQRAAFD
ncbi:hypothetical protein ACGFRG_32395 [Streptomyces sp. NPDC048696]|uniref:hypothetical protein n=1 Tax=Streptomyces sp. NPDC048696 TaxID=3365585 RepID=UPI003715AC82